MDLNPYLSFAGNCEEAFQLYEKCLGGKIVFQMTFGDSPMKDQAPPDWGKKIMHASLKVANITLQGADAPPDRYEKPKGFGISISMKDTPEEAERIFNELAAGGSVDMPIQETFWAQRFGMLRDRFGIPWMVNCEKSA